MASSSISAPMIAYTDRRVHDDSTPQDSSYSLSKLSEITRVISSSKEAFARTGVSVTEAQEEVVTDDPEFKLPSKSSLFVVIGGNAIFQLSFFIIVSSASFYAEHLGGSATFSGLTIGIPTVFSGITLIFVTRKDGGQYKMPFQLAYASMLVGNVLYALAYRADFLYLILIGRMITGLGFISFMYSKRYCTDPRIVGVRRRTTLAGWLVIGQAFGFSAGPFFGGLLFKVGFSNPIFNGATSPGWIMAAIWGMFWILSNYIFQDVPARTETPSSIELTSPDSPRQQSPPAPVETSPSFRSLTSAQWGVVICMCYYSMTCFFILGSWESNIPVFTASALNYSPYNAGNFIALGGLCSFPFLLLNVWYARRLQDRTILAIGNTFGLAGLLIMLAILQTDRVTPGSLFVCWFLIALGFNLASTCTLSLLSKQLPDNWNRKSSMVIQYSNYTGRVTGAILGGAGVKIGMINYAGIHLAVVGLGIVMYLTLWRQLKAKTG
ncbi:membrane transporter [Agrocybe pediades]|nr:membrane transporter [Agrocybe pediades]